MGFLTSHRMSRSDAIWPIGGKIHEVPRAAGDEERLTALRDHGEAYADEQRLRHAEPRPPPRQSATTSIRNHGQPLAPAKTGRGNGALTSNPQLRYNKSLRDDRIPPGVAVVSA